MNIKKLLGKRIQEIRKAKKLTQEKVAEYIGIETNSLSNIETGRFYPTSENLEKIIKILEISPRELFECEHLQSDTDLLKEINDILTTHPEKIKEFYKILKSII